MRSKLVFFLIFATVIAEIADNDVLLPPQNVFLNRHGVYVTKPDQQAVETEVEVTTEAPAVKACQPKLESEAEIKQVLDFAQDFNDTSPLNVTVIDDPMEVKIYKPECDD